jgi:hypothetical protein
MRDYPFRLKISFLRKKSVIKKNHGTPNFVKILTLGATFGLKITQISLDMCACFEKIIHQYPLYTILHIYMYETICLIFMVPNMENCQLDY